MLVETADASAVAMRISRAEWTALREADIRTAVDSALETHGLAPWTSMKIELFVAEKEVLLIARPISDPPRRFRFRSFADLTAALGCFPAGLDSDVVYIDGSWELFVRAEDEALPNALFEFGEPAVHRGTVRTYRRTRRRGRPPRCRWDPSALFLLISLFSFSAGCAKL